MCLVHAVLIMCLEAYVYLRECTCMQTQIHSTFATCLYIWSTYMDTYMCKNWCVYIFVYTCFYICLYITSYMSLYMFLYMCLYTCLYMCLYMRLYIHICFTCACAYLSIPAFLFIHEFMAALICVFAHILTHTLIQHILLTHTRGIRGRCCWRSLIQSGCITPHTYICLFTVAV